MYPPQFDYHAPSSISAALALLAELLLRGTVLRKIP